MIAKLFDSHKCDVPLKDIIEIPVSSIYESSTEKRKCIVGVGLDGIRYWFVVKTREAIPISTDFTRGDESTDNYTVPENTKLIY